MRFRRVETGNEIEMDGNLSNLENLSALGSREAMRSDTGGTAHAHRVPLTKRVLDIGCILLALPTLLPLFLGIALFIKIVSPGPVFFRQSRVGHLGRRFQIFKFRTMKVNAEVGTH